MQLVQFLGLAAILFSFGIYGVLTRKNAVMLLMSIELLLNAAALNFVAFGAFHDTVVGQVFVVFVIGIAAAEVAVGLAIVMLMYRHQGSVDIDRADELKG